MFTYSAYNLCIHSELLLPDLILTQADDISAKPPDVLIQLRDLSPLEIKAADGGKSFLGNSFLKKLEVGKFLVNHGRQIIIQPIPGVEEALIRSLVLGHCMSILLRQRGLLVLHGSCVAVNGGAVAFLGHSGWGKSTLASAFYNIKYSVITDDMMAVDLKDSYAITFPAYPQVKLLPDAAASFGYDFERLASVHSGCPKRNNRLDQEFPQAPLPIKRIYVLENVAATRNEIEAISVQDALVELIRHSRATDLLTTPEFVSSHLRQCANLVQRVPICRLKRKRSLAALPDIVKLVEEDIAETVSQKSDGELFLSTV